MVIAAILSVAGDLAHDLGQFIVVGEDRPAIPIAAQRFARKEAGAGNGGEVAAFAAFVGGAKALRGVFNDGDSMLLSDGINGIVVGTLAVQADGNDGFGARGDCRFQQGWV